MQFLLGLNLAGFEMRDELGRYYPLFTFSTLRLPALAGEDMVRDKGFRDDVFTLSAP
jgi:hypothetical protein